MTDTVRPLIELLDALFASNQAPRSITEQDMRDAIVSISLETGDFSDLPRSTDSLAVGRCWVDTNLALRVILSYQPLVASAAATGSGDLIAQPFILPSVLMARLVGSGGLIAQPYIGGTPILTGFGGLTATPQRFVPILGSATLSGTGNLVPTARLRPRASAVLAGVGSPIPTARQRMSVSAVLSGVAGLVPTARQRMRVSATIAGAGGRTFNGQLGATTTFSPANKSTYITLSNINQTATKTANAGWYGGVVGTVFKATGKWYWEFSIGQKAGDTGLGLANPSWPVDNGDPAFGSYLGLPGATTSIGLYSNGSVGYTNDGVSSSITPMPNVASGGNVGFALDCANWKWWARQDGGAWNVGQAGAQDPATNQGGIPIAAGYRVGGMAPAVTLQGLNDVVIGRFGPSSWSFIAPAGFSAP